MRYKKITTLGVLAAAAPLAFAVPPTIDGVRYPGGNIALVADGNSRDPDDIGGTAISLALLRAADMSQFLVHSSYACDLVREEDRITAAQERIRFTDMRRASMGTASRWQRFDGLNFFNASPAPRQANPTPAQRQAAIDEADATITDLAAAINASTFRSLLYIVEAGEPDVIYKALERAQFFKSRNVRIITHSFVNDSSGDFHNLSPTRDENNRVIPEFTRSPQATPTPERITYITTDFPDVQVLRIPDQNQRLISEIDSNGNSAYDWARDSSQGRIRWLFSRLARAEEESIVAPFQADQYDPSDAGMVAYWVTGANGDESNPGNTDLRGRATPNPVILEALINR